MPARRQGAQQLEILEQHGATVATAVEQGLPPDRRGAGVVMTEGAVDQAARRVPLRMPGQGGEVVLWDDSYVIAQRRGDRDQRWLVVADVIVCDHHQRGRRECDAVHHTGDLAVDRMAGYRRMLDEAPPHLGVCVEHRRRRSVHDDHPHQL
jgi:hypothetical protein